MHRHSRFFTTHSGRRLGLVLCLAAMLGGCTLPIRPVSESSGVVVGEGAGVQLDAALGGFLSQAPVGAVYSLADSPWGSQVEVIVEDAYLAASGRECRKLKVLRAGAGGESRELACQNARGWDARRLVTEVVTGAQR